MEQPKWPRITLVATLLLTYINSHLLVNITSQETTFASKFTEKLRTLRKRRTISIEIKWASKDNFYGVIGVGSPVQTFHVVFDTGSDILWLPARQSQLSQVLQTERTYKRSASTTYNFVDEVFSREYEIGGIMGVISEDTLWVGKHFLKNFRFGEGIRMLEVPPFSRDYDGIFGLAPDWGGSPFGSSVINQLRQCGSIDEAAFSYYICPTDSQNPPHGELSFGSTSNAVHYVDLYPGEYWYFNITSMRLGSTLICTECEAVLDTGSDLSMGSDADVYYFNKVLGGIELTNGVFELECEQLEAMPLLKLELGSHTFILSPMNYTIQRMSDTGRRCYSGVQFAPNDESLTTWTFGYSLLRNFFLHVSEEKRRVGFGDLQC